MMEKKTGNIWAINVGAPYIFLSDWNIYSANINGVRQSCTIHFHPETQTATSLLPVPIQQLGTLLNETLGNDQHEGTLHHTANIKVKVMHMWANVAMRPWAALKAQPYNSRKQVDISLKKWSQKTASYNKLYQNILIQYPKAEQALIEYYKIKFGQSHTEANLTAKQTLDIAFRTYFVFLK